MDNPFSRDCDSCATFRAHLQLAKDAWNRMRSTGRYIPTPAFPVNQCDACGGSGFLLTPAAQAFKDAILAELEAKWTAERKAVHHGKA